MTARPILRPEARTALLQALAGLGASTVEDRSAAALDVHRIATAAGVEWGKLIEPDPRAEIERLLLVQTLPQADRDQLALMLRWRRIGEPGQEIIESIKQRLAGARADLTA